ncbi:HET domain-containing protein [Seiridium cupressi]
MAGAFPYNRSETGQSQLFKLDVDEPAGPRLSGQLVTLHHPRSYDLVLKRLAKSYWNWNDTRYLERSGSGVWARQTQLLLQLRASERVWQGKTLKTNDPSSVQGQISITANLHELLLELHNRCYDDSIWIDAICINQRDSAEKIMQIPLMRNIYEETKRILVWLGPANDVTKRALMILPNLTKIFEGIDPHTYMFDRNNLETLISKRAPLPEDPIGPSIGHPMVYPRFMWLWTLQEVTLSSGWSLRNKSTVGNTTTGWDSCAMIDICWEMHCTPPEGQAPTGTMFGMKGLMAVNAVNQMGPVDVTWLLPRVYVQCARYYFHQPRECILNHVASAYRDQGLPSWCPDFSQPESAPQGTMTTGWVEMKPTSVSGPDGSVLGSVRYP